MNPEAPLVLLRLFCLRITHRVFLGLICQAVVGMLLVASCGQPGSSHSQDMETPDLEVPDPERQGSWVQPVNDQQTRPSEPLGTEPIAGHREPVPQEVPGGGETKTFHLAAGETHVFEFELAVGESLEGEIGQRGLDVEALLYEPTGLGASCSNASSSGGEGAGMASLAHAHDSQPGLPTVLFDLPVGKDAPETLCFVPRRPGKHLLEIRSVRGEVGGYDLSLRWLETGLSRRAVCQKAIQGLGWALEGCVNSSVADPEQIFQRFLRSQVHWAEAQRPFEEAVTLKELASCRVRLARPAGAEEGYRQALALFTEQGKKVQQIQTSLDLGRLLLGEGRLEEAESEFISSLQSAQEWGLEAQEAASLDRLGFLAWVRGEALEAADLHRQAHELWSKNGQGKAAGRALQGVGDSYTLLGQFLEARDVLEESVQIAVSSGDVFAEPNARLRLAWALALAGDPAAALEHYRLSLQLYRQQNRPKGESAVLGRLGSALAALGRGEEALASFRQALAVAEDGQSSVSLLSRAHGLTNIGCQEEKLGLAAATGTLSQALELFSSLDDPYGAAQTQFCAARAARSQGNLEKAAGFAASALESVEEARRRGLAVGGRLVPLPLWHSYVELTVDIALRRAAQVAQAAEDNGEVAQADRGAVRAKLLQYAFEVSDSARARPLQELVGDMPQPSGESKSSGALDSLVRQRARVEAIHTAALERQLAEDRGTRPPLLEALKRRQRRLALEWQAGDRALRKQLQASGSPALPQPVSARQALALLGDDTALLSFALGRASSTLFVLHQGTVSTHSLPARARLEGLALALHRIWGGGDQRRSRDMAALKAATLSEQLFAPLAATGLLQGEDAPKRLVIVAEGLLQYIPFGALPVPWESSDFGPAARFLDLFELASIPSVAVLAALRKRDEQRSSFKRSRSSTEPEPLLVTVFGDPLYSLEDSRRGEAGEQRGSGSNLPDPLPRLRHSRREAEAIFKAAQGKAKIFLGTDASRERVLAADYPRAQWLHFSAHALLDEERPELSSVVFSAYDAQGNSQEGNLRLPDIASLYLPVDLVVLSGCQTALGKNVRGDALQGLARGFFHAGASRLLVSLWSVNDAATADLMELFYQRAFRQGLSPAAALRAAQQELRSRPGRESPYYWAGFVVQGDWR